MRTRQDVIDAGTAILRESGPAALTSVAVAKRVGVTQPAIYRHVSGMDELTTLASHAVVGELTSILVAAATAPATTWGDGSHLRAFARQLVDLISDHQHAFATIERWRYDASELGEGIRSMLGMGAALICNEFEAAWRGDFRSDVEFDEATRATQLIHAELLIDDVVAAARLVRERRVPPSARGPRPESAVVHRMVRIRDGDQHPDGVARARAREPSVVVTEAGRRVTDPGRRRPRRDQAIEHAADLLRERGPQGLTSAAVAERMGITQPGVYRHVRNMDELTELAAERVVAGITESLHGIVFDESMDWDDIGDVDRLCRSLIDVAMANRQSFDVVTLWRFTDGPLGNGIRSVIDESCDLISALMESRSAYRVRLRGFARRRATARSAGPCAGGIRRRTRRRPHRVLGPPLGATGPRCTCHDLQEPLGVGVVGVRDRPERAHRPRVPPHRPGDGHRGRVSIAI